MKRIIGVMIALAATSLTVSAQDFRGAVTGRIVDSSSARMPGVTVTATNVATNVASSTVTNGEGEYSILFLNPGTYTVSAELSGFKKVVRPGISVSIGDKLDVNMTLEIGSMEETVSVTAESPMLATTSGSTGQVIGEKVISMMPLSDGNPFALARLAPGITYNGDLKFSRPFDNGGTSGIVTGGASGGNEFSLDGSPNMANGQRVAFVPPAGAVQEFKVETASFDAGSGHTAGATVNVTLKSGTNSVRGSGYTYYRSDKLAETDFFVLKAGTPKPKLGYKRPGFTVGGPLVIPGLYDGHDKTFFFGAMEWLYDLFPEPLSQTVPTQAMRNGDFSALLAQGIVLYDPLTAQTVGSNVVRQPFSGNIIPTGRINPIAQKILSYYPLPNQTANSSGQENFFYSNPRDDKFNSESVRVDHTLTSKQHIMVRYTRNDRRESRNAQFGVVNGVVPTGNFLFRKNDGVTYDHTYTQSSSSLWDIRAGWQRFREPNVRQHEGVFDPASLGFSPAVAGLFGGAQYFPGVTFATISGIGDNLAGNTTHTIYSFQPTYTRLAGQHSLRAGYDLRLYHEFAASLGRQAGEYTNSQTGAFTRPQDNSAAQVWGDVASFLLGYPTGGSIEINGTRTNDSWYHAAFVQDDWKISSRLTLNLGLRYDLEMPPTEAQNANVRGFDPNAVLSLSGAAEAKYAANPIPQIAPSAWKARGGVQFASDQNRGFWNADKNNIQPRAGFAYKWNDNTVIRGGWGLYSVPFVFSRGINQMGFSQSTPLTVTQDRGLTFVGTLSNPWPSGVLQPAGNALGPNTFLGQSLTRFSPLDFQNAMLSRYLVNLQRELPGQWLLEVGYAGSHGYHLTTDEELNAVPSQYLTTSRARDQATVDLLGAAVPNPFFGLLPTGFTGATVARQQLLRPFPQFNNVPTSGTDGTSKYDSAQVRLERRFSKGYSILGTYTFSHFTERVFRLNPTDANFENRLSRDDVPHRVTTSFLYELPFGQGRRWGGQSSGFVNALVGGWSVNALGQLQSGRPLDFAGRNIYFNGDPNTLKAKYSNNSDAPVFDISGFYFHDAAVQTNGVDDPAKQRNDQRIRLANNVRYFPSRIDGIRSPFLNLWDISLVKQVPIGGRVRAQVNIEFLNALNRVVFNDATTDPTNASFGKVTSQNNLPRDIQIGAKIVF
ncbi:MAG TPA: carboxypeptidase regulatory-like domain-containing protein [Vicinamibacterales bacterium]|nr:carboxypeptidase regulatory-like domain-containing protein [Vicinamibacterales bacterium]